MHDERSVRGGNVDEFGLSRWLDGGRDGLGNLIEIYIAFDDAWCLYGEGKMRVVSLGFTGVHTRRGRIDGHCVV